MKVNPPSKSDLEPVVEIWTLRAIGALNVIGILLFGIFGVMMTGDRDGEVSVLPALGLLVGAIALYCFIKVITSICENLIEIRKQLDSEKK